MSHASEKQRRSPLKRKPLHNPGESLQEEIQRLLDERFMPPLLMALLATLFALFEWWRWAAKAPPQPIVLTLVAVAAIGYGVYRTVSLRKRLRSLRLGLDGEKAVGQFLEGLRSQQCCVFHDIVGAGFNIDHVVVAPQGVFTIETKTFSKPARGQAVVEYDGETMAFNGLEPDRNPVVQARAARDWLRDLLQETTAMRYPVRGVVVLPGWFVEPAKDGKRVDVWVLNPRALPSFIEHQPVVLKDEDIALVASRLTNYITR